MQLIMILAFQHHQPYHNSLGFHDWGGSLRMANDSWNTQCGLILYIHICCWFYELINVFFVTCINHILTPISLILSCHSSASKPTSSLPFKASPAQLCMHFSSLIHVTSTTRHNKYCENYIISYNGYRLKYLGNYQPLQKSWCATQTPYVNNHPNLLLWSSEI